MLLRVVAPYEPCVGDHQLALDVRVAFIVLDVADKVEHFLPWV